MGMRFRNIALPALIATFAAGTSAREPGAKSTRVPVDFNCNRFFVTPTTQSGQKLRLFSDSGGGTIMISQSAATRLGLQITTTTVPADGGKSEQFFITSFPAFDSAATIPPMLPAADTRYALFRGKVFVMPDATFTGQNGVDGLLGSQWFGGRAWTFDYASGSLAYGESSAKLPPPHSIKLGFQLGDSGERSESFASVVATVDDVAYPFLFDTGATIRLSQEAAEAMGVPGVSECGTSFIVSTLFDAWRTAHPDWKVIKGADLNGGGASAIQVPQVTIAGWSVGPVWFTRREDHNFHEMMSSYTDVRIEGALGGSLFRYFTIVADYPRATATFRRNDTH